MNEHYSAVLGDLRVRREKLEAELRDIEAAIGGLQRLLGESPVIAQPWTGSPVVSPPPSQARQTLKASPKARFSNISVRWGVLWFLAEDAGEAFVKTGEIASALLEGGYKTEAVRFPNLVSAVLSAMKTKGEVETSDDGGGYRLTEQGRATWNNIRHGAKFRYATSSEHSLLSVQ
jgi:hypothetical protein